MPSARVSSGSTGRLRRAAQHAGERRQQHEGQHHDEVLDDQPADRDPAPLRLHHAALLQGAQQHHGAGDGKRQAEDEAAAGRPAHRQCKQEAEEGRHDDLADRSGNGDGPHGEEILQRKMQADAEHQQDDADFRELVRQLLVGDETGRERADDDAGKKVAGDRRQAEAMCDQPRQEGEADTGNQGCDQRCRMGQARLSLIRGNSRG